MQDSPYGLAALWLQGDMVIKVVSVLLLLMSIVSWYVIVTRAWQAFKLRASAKVMGEFWHAQSFDEGIQILQSQDRHSPFSALALGGQAAVEHHNDSKHDLHGQISLTEWLTESLRADIDDNAERMQAGLPILASVGSTAPFVGLFGTVWGIYHALVGIGASGQASIDKVAGPVGEALIMTAFGLAVAIPAVLGYNTLMRSNKTTIKKMQRFARQLHAYFLTGRASKHNAGAM
ncbi:MAG: MotA/TolQ/ExbB proton channel family protein [Agitococcus sp.]|jgi:biopolymer transport protein ExbB|nr:MotA/TolQ/ExbB proton channel family protein [Moraxellaceae bacterium]MBP9216641.1 MotA/TolQ/ExbB proton channel family protein [Agitococcus sp.]MBK8326817.1 MotA/TolQ/ExbB proton channel family protein [Moraxellaceae bacterium]MBK9185840.1 MotA/TolQ/ExbB proton channel family protein [Moraxellaceae bacterium]MBL0230512.1 MotA/TolQ/ExbB proton channel family protein [Moraxellaceae bacterium]